MKFLYNVGMKKRVISAAMFLILFSAGIHAQEKLSLNECISLALKNSAHLKAEEFNVKEKEALYRKARSAALPQAEFNSDFQRKLGYNNYSFSANISLDLQKVIFGRGTSEKLNFEGAKWQNRNIEATLVYLVKAAYFDLLLSQDEYAIADKACRNIRHQRDVGAALVKSGVKLQSALFRIDAQLEKTKAVLSSKQANAAVAKLKLRELLGVSPADVLSIAEYSETLPLLPDSSSVIQQALAGSPEIKALDYRYKAALNELRLSKGFLLPKLAVGTSYNKDGSPGGDGLYPDYHFSASLPLFYSGKNMYEIQRRQAAVQKLKWQMASMTRQLASKTAVLYEKAKASREKYLYYQKAFAAISKTLKLSGDEYSSGVISESDLLDIARNAVEIEIEKDRAFYDYMILLAELEYLKGGTH